MTSLTLQTQNNKLDYADGTAQGLNVQGGPSPVPVGITDLKAIPHRLDSCTDLIGQGFNASILKYGGTGAQIRLGTRGGGTANGSNQRSSIRNLTLDSADQCIGIDESCKDYQLNFSAENLCLRAGGLAINFRRKNGEQNIYDPILRNIDVMDSGKGVIDLYCRAFTLDTLRFWPSSNRQPYTGGPAMKVESTTGLIINGRFDGFQRGMPLLYAKQTVLTLCNNYWEWDGAPAGAVIVFDGCKVSGDAFHTAPSPKNPIICKAGTILTLAHVLCLNDGGSAPNTDDEYRKLLPLCYQMQGGSVLKEGGRVLIDADGKLTGA